VFVVMGDGDCCSIGAAHWLHAVRYNMDMVALMLDNNIYGLTKNQTSPTTPQGFPSRTQPHGSWLPPLNPLEATLGITNASFVAQTAEWIPAHLYATLQAAYRHRGFAFVRILQRCPEFTPLLYADAVKKTDLNEFLVHDDGVMVPELEKVLQEPDASRPPDLDAARRWREDMGDVRLGVFFRDESRPRYEETRRVATPTVREKLTPTRSGARPLCRLTPASRAALDALAGARESFRSAVAGRRGRGGRRTSPRTALPRNGVLARPRRQELGAFAVGRLDTDRFAALFAEADSSTGRPGAHGARAPCAERLRARPGRSS
jgi:hypothetical protein